MVVRNPAERVLDRAGYTLASALGTRGRWPVTPSQASGSGQLCDQCVDLAFCRFGAVDLSECFRIRLLIAKLGKPASIGCLGLVVQHLSRITEISEVDTDILELRGLHRRISRYAGVLCLASELDCMKLGVRLAQKPRYIGESLDIYQADRFLLVGKCPEFSVAAKNRRIRGVSSWG